MDVDVAALRARAHGTGHHVVQLEESRGVRGGLGCPSAPPTARQLEPRPADPYLLEDEVQADALLPVNVGVPQAWQLLGVPPVHLHLHLHLGLGLGQLQAQGRGEWVPLWHRRFLPGHRTGQVSAQMPARPSASS